MNAAAGTPDASASAPEDGIEAAAEADGERSRAAPEPATTAAPCAPGVTPARPGVMHLLTRLAKVLHRKSTEELLGMRFRHFMALSYLADRDGVSQQTLGEDLLVDANNVVILLNELEAAGFAERRRDPLDRRRHTVVVTDAGRRAIERAEHAREELEDEMLARLTPEERANLGDLLRRALEAH